MRARAGVAVRQGPKGEEDARIPTAIGPGAAPLGARPPDPPSREEREDPKETKLPPLLRKLAEHHQQVAWRHPFL